eukprot:15845764-Heterocapsa_arctica.AAC.1
MAIASLENVDRDEVQGGVVLVAELLQVASDVGLSGSASEEVQDVKCARRRACLGVARRRRGSSTRH